MTKKRETRASTIKEHYEEGYSRIRVERDLERRANEVGFGATPQGDALYREYCEKLEMLIGANSVNSRRPHDVWGALVGLKVEDIAERLFKLGVTAATASSIGVDRKTKTKNARDVLLWLGDKLSQLQRIDRELEARIGAWGVSFLRQLDAFDLDENKVLVLVRTERLERVFKDVVDRVAYHNPYLLPPTEKSAPWTGVRQGPIGNQIALVSRRYSEPAVQEAIDNGQMSRVLEAVNALQDVWWVINKPVLNIAKQLPPPILPPPEKGLTEDEIKKQKKRFKRSRTKAKEYHEDMELIDILADKDRQFNIPHDMDFRGRVYGIPHINYQRADHIRGLFLFAKGERLGVEGLSWLKYHVVGCADGNSWSDRPKPSKLNPDKRIAWTECNLKRLCKIADDVLNDIIPERQWLPDDPIPFLAACVELKQALDTTPVSDFITRLPIKFDGCCSGLQHFCPVMRSPEGRLANLTASGKQKISIPQL
jgi:DNA-directed RNA polymerase